MSKLSANRKSESTGIVKSTALPHTYAQVFNDLKIRIRQSQIKAALSVNRHLIKLYWHIGKVIVERQHAEGWGKSVVEHLAHDLHREFPDIAGFSPRNIWRMRSLYIAYTEEIQKLPQPVAELDGDIMRCCLKNLAVLSNVFGMPERLLKTAGHGTFSHFK